MMRNEFQLPSKDLQRVADNMKASGGISESLDIAALENEIARRKEKGLSEDGILVDRKYTREMGYFWAAVLFGGTKLPISHPAVECIFCNTRTALVNPHAL